MMNTYLDSASISKQKNRPHYILRCLLHHSVIVSAVMLTLVMYILSILYIQQLKTQWYSMQRSHQKSEQQLHDTQVAYDELQSEQVLLQIADTIKLQEPAAPKLRYMNQHGQLLVKK